MEWKEGNLGTARELYQKALSIDSTTESAARCLQVTDICYQFYEKLALSKNCSSPFDRTAVFSHCRLGVF